MNKKAPNTRYIQKRTQAKYTGVFCFVFLIPQKSANNWILIKYWYLKKKKMKFLFIRHYSLKY